MPGSESIDPDDHRDVDEAQLSQVRQDVQAQRDAYVAAGDLHIHHTTHLHVYEAAKPPGRPDRLRGPVPTRNPNFTGRENVLRTLRDALTASNRVAVQALRGIGGVGKTQLAAEYAHRHADQYSVTWWINAENATLVPEQLAALAIELERATPDTPVTTAAQSALSDLRNTGDWLLIFDNAKSPDMIAPWLPGGHGHVLITSRASGWHDIATQLDIDVLPRNESITLLRNRIQTLTPTDADAVAEAVGDLPLALAQAAAYLAATGAAPATYVDLVQTNAATVLAEGKPPAYPATLAAVIILTWDKLRHDNSAAADLAAVCAFLAPDPIPMAWFPHTAKHLPRHLRKQAADSAAWPHILSHLTGTSLARLDSAGLVFHRLTQAILRSHFTSHDRTVIRKLAESVVAASVPDDSGNLPENWPAWARLVPHVLALDPGTSGNPALWDAALHAAWSLAARGDAPAALDMAGELYNQWRHHLGPDHNVTLRAANTLTQARRDLGRYAEARDLDRDSLDKLRRRHGEDHPNTLGTACNLALDLGALGNHQAARQLNEDTLNRLRRTLGDNHPHTLNTANNLAIDLHALGDHQAARQLNEDTLNRSRHAFGDSHPSTLTTANNLADNLHALGDYQAARELNEDTLNRLRAGLGDNHPTTLIVANNLAENLHALGHYQAARELDQDTLERLRQVLGEDHPYTQHSARNLAADMRALGDEAPD